MQSTFLHRLVAIVFLPNTAIAILKLTFLRDETIDHKIRKVTVPEPLCRRSGLCNLSFALFSISHVDLTVQFLPVVLCYQKSNIPS